MKYLSLFPLILLFACANHRLPKSYDPKVAKDSLDKGRVKASAIKKLEKQVICFKISLSISGGPSQQAQSKNWSLAWVDKKNHYHLLSLNQRDPASIPKGGQVMARTGERNDWQNTFRACTPKAQLDDVTGIVLTPKALHTSDKRSLRLEWP